MHASMHASKDASKHTGMQEIKHASMKASRPACNQAGKQEFILRKKSWSLWVCFISIIDKKYDESSHE